VPLKAGLFYVHSDGGTTSRLLSPLLLIHGAGGTHLHWPPEIRHIESATVYAVDLCGHGQSKGKASDSIREYAQCLMAWMDALDITRVIPVGHSMGGAIVQTMALEMPERVAGLVLVATGGRLRVNPQILELTADGEHCAQAADLITQWAFSEHADQHLIELGRARYAEARPESIHADFVACDRFDVMERLSEITVPALVVCGGEDRLTPPKYSQYLAGKIPNSRLVIIENAGHMVMLEKPGEVAAQLRQFIDSDSF
jgi:pimeloyl-ACP methyl ester carboxylesterase